MFYTQESGLPLRPGEVWLAHYGVRLPETLSEYRRRGLEVLPQLRENGVTRILSPAHRLLVALAAEARGWVSLSLAPMREVLGNVLI